MLDNNFKKSDIIFPHDRLLAKTVLKIIPKSVKPNHLTVFRFLTTPMVYDPLADKILISAMVFIIVLKYIGFWTSIFIVSIEVVIIIVAWVRKRRGAEIQANIWGKIKMMLQVLGVAILLLSIIFNWAGALPLASGTLYLAIAFAIVSLLTYGI
jgi:phosphatidylglycerophosphate synthase